MDGLVKPATWRIKITSHKPWRSNELIQRVTVPEIKLQVMSQL